jgi:hypothetical protein
VVEVEPRVVTFAPSVVSSCRTTQNVQEDSMTALRVSKAEIPSELREMRIKQFGGVAEPVEVTWHSPKVAQAALEFGAKIATWDAADESLKTFARIAVAAQVCCRLLAEAVVCPACMPSLTRLTAAS